eukprot:gene3744-biopygen3681
MFPSEVRTSSEIKEDPLYLEQANQLLYDFLCRVTIKIANAVVRGVSETSDGCAAWQELVKLQRNTSVVYFTRQVKELFAQANQFATLAPPLHSFLGVKESLRRIREYPRIANVTYVGHSEVSSAYLLYDHDSGMVTFSERLDKLGEVVTTWDPSAVAPLKTNFMATVRCALPGSIAYSAGSSCAGTSSYLEAGQELLSLLRACPTYGQIDAHYPLSRRSGLSLLSSDRIVIVLALNLGLVVYHMDVETAFLNSVLEEDLYVVRYLRITVDHELVLRAASAQGGYETGSLRSTPLPLCIYTDADYAGCRTTRKSTSGIAVFLCGSLVIFPSMIQQCVSISATEAEIMAMSKGAREIKYILNVLDSLVDIHKPVAMYCDNQGAIHLASDYVNNSRSKHIELGGQG